MSILEDHRRLANLLTSQQQALEADDAQKLAALLPQIEDYGARLRRHSPSLPGIVGEARRELEGLRKKLLDLARENEEAYRQRRRRLKAIQDQLRSSDRYAQQARAKRESGGRRLRIEG